MIARMVADGSERIELVPVLFTFYRSDMDDHSPRKLLPVTPEELEQAVSHALRFDGRKHFKLAGEIMGEDHGRAPGPVSDAGRVRGDEGATASAAAGVRLCGERRPGDDRRALSNERRQPGQ